MRHPTTARPSLATRIVVTLQTHLGRTLAIVAAITAVLVIPFLAMAPTESASTEPAGDVFTARDRIDDTFASTVRGIGFVIEDPDGDILRAEPLAELLDAQQRLRTDPNSARRCSATSRSRPPGTSPASSASPISSTPSCGPPRTSAWPTPPTPRSRSPAPR
jgi:hypothetical protein